MNIGELMIGDWVYRVDFKEPIPVRILGLEVVNYDTHPMQYVADVFCPKHNNNVGLYMDEICPIPLTAEILEKNGFVINKHVYPYPYYEYINSKDNLKIGFAYPRGNRTSYKEPWVYIDSEYVFVEHLPCMYVHELQHALRLCGIDKEIKL